MGMVLQEEEVSQFDKSEHQTVVSSYLWFAEIEIFINILHYWDSQRWSCIVIFHKQKSFQLFAKALYKNFKCVFR